MSLIELLVVVTIIGLLAVAVLPNLAGGNGQREVRIAAGTVSSQLMRGSSLAIEQRRQAGVWLEPLQSRPWACIDLFSATTLDPYQGELSDSAFTVVPTVNDPLKAAINPHPRNGTNDFSAITSMTRPDPKTSVAGNFGIDGNLIQFEGRGPLFEIKFTRNPDSGRPQFMALMRSAVGQTTANTLWPAPGIPHSFSVYRLPTRQGQPLSLPGGAAIDLYWSEIGGTLLSNPSLYTPQSRIVILYGRTGAFSEVCFLATAAGAGSTRRLPAGGVVFFLVGRADRCGLPAVSNPTEQNPGANWQYPESFWVGLDPQTGITKVAEVRPNATTVLESQEYIRAGLTAVRL